MKCKYCGQIKKDVKTVNDPYSEDVYNKIVRRKLCKKCIKEIAEDI